MQPSAAATSVFFVVVIFIVEDHSFEPGGANRAGPLWVGTQNGFSF
jgi:hypothetical protein